MSEVPSHIQKLAASHCEPLFLSVPYLGDGHTPEKANGTITFIEYRGRIFGITCAHVYEEQEPTGKWLTLHGSERYIYQLGTLTPDGYKSLFRPLRNNPNDNGADIAIIELGESVKQVHFDCKGKQAINLDNWVEPNWNEIDVPVAFGYPTEHKKIQSKDVLGCPLLSVAAEITRPISTNDATFLLASSFESDNVYFFSGMSGGPVYSVTEPDGNPDIIGIVFEGTPGSSKEWNTRDDQSFYTEKDIQIRAYTFTPDIFEQWLQQVNYL